MKKHEADDDSLPSLLPLHLVYIQNVPVYAGTTRTRWKHMCAWCRHTRGFQRVTHHTHHAPHHNPPQQHDHQPHHTETDTERDKERRGDGREEDKRIEERSEKILYRCGGAWPFFVGVVIFWLIPFARDTVAC